MDIEEFENLQVGDRLTNIAALNGVIITHRIEHDEGGVTFRGILPVEINDPSGWAKIKKRPDLTILDIEQGFRHGEKFAHVDGRRVCAIHPPGYFVGEDNDSLLVQFEGVDYGGDFWDEVQVSNLVGWWE